MHLTDEDQILHYYGEDGSGDRVAIHLAECEACAREYAALQRMLDATSRAAPAPARSEAYGAQVWARLQPRLELHARVVPSRSEFWWLPRPASLPRWGMVAAAAALIVVAFVAGRISRDAPVSAPGAAGTEVRERILLVAVGDHLERSQVILIELINGERPVDPTTGQAEAADLAAANRLYRLAAARSGEETVASVLDQLERVLLEIAHAPADQSDEEWDRLRTRIESEGLLFKIRILGSNVRQRELADAAARTSS